MNEQKFSNQVLFRLSDEALKQIKEPKRKICFKTIFAVLLFVASCVSGFLVGYVQNTILEMLCTGFLGIGTLVSVILFIGSSDSVGGSFNPEFGKEIEEARTETGYFGKDK